jgi:hypothetical protein
MVIFPSSVATVVTVPTSSAPVSDSLLDSLLLEDFDADVDWL